MCCPTGNGRKRFLPQGRDTMHQNNPRTWPFTIRVTLEERRLLAKAAVAEKTSRAGILRQGLDPVIARLAVRFDASNGSV